jgi:alpha,alpha-trehalase
MICCTLGRGGPRANLRKQKLNELCWNEASSMYFEYDFVQWKQFPFETAKPHFSFMDWNAHSEHQAKNLVEIAASIH